MTCDCLTALSASYLLDRCVELNNCVYQFSMKLKNLIILWMQLLHCSIHNDVVQEKKILKNKYLGALD